jgi:hypothetical protein
VVRVVGQEPLEVSVAEGVAEAELAGTDALPEPLDCEPPPLEGTGGADWKDPLPSESSPPVGAVAEQLQSVTVTVFTTVLGEPEGRDSEGGEGTETEPVGAGAGEPEPELGVDSETGAEGVD